MQETIHDEELAREMARELRLEIPRSGRAMNMRYFYGLEKFTKTFISLTLACLILLPGCAGSVSKTTERGLFRIKLSAKGQILKVGRNEVDIDVTDDKGTGVEGASIEITPWMPEHGHGAMWPPTVTEKGKGLYRAIIPLLMAGHWQLKVGIHKGDVDDKAIFEFPYVSK